MKFDLSHVHQIYSLRYNSRFLRVAPLRMANIEEVIVLITVGPLCIQEFMNSLIRKEKRTRSFNPFEAPDYLDGSLAGDFG